MASSLSGIGEIVAYLPYQFGFVPRDSLVLIGVRDGGVQVCARVDRPSPADAVAQARDLAQSVVRSDPDDVIVLGYDGFGTAERLFALELRSLLSAWGIGMSHVAVVQNGAWRAGRCSCGGCPREWQSVPPHCGLAPVAEQVLRGVVPVQRRSDLERRFELLHPRVADAVEERILRTPLWIQTSRVLPAVLLDERTPVPALPVDMLAPATMAVASIQIRDEILSWLMPDFMPVDAAPPDEIIDPHHLGLPPMWLREVGSFDDPVTTVARRLEEWVTCIPRHRSVPVLMLLAGFRWTTGNGVLASMAVARALDIDPSCPLALLIDQALRAGLRPQMGQQRSA